MHWHIRRTVASIHLTQTSQTFSQQTKRVTTALNFLINDFALKFSPVFECMDKFCAHSVPFNAQCVQNTAHEEEEEDEKSNQNNQNYTALK